MATNEIEERIQEQTVGKEIETNKIEKYKGK